MSGDRGTLATLRRLGVPRGADVVVVQAVEAGCCAQVLRWLVGKRAPLGSGGAAEAAVAGSRWLTAEEGAGLRGPPEPCWLGGVTGCSPL